MMFFVLNTFLILGAAAAALADGAAPTQQQPGFGNMLTLFLPMIAVFYFLMIRPQQKRMKEQQTMLSQLKQGDEVVTNSGILGTITGITEKIVTLEIDDKVRVKMLKTQVAQVLKGQNPLELVK
jgi:preprotein translocase subunit YajC